MATDSKGFFSALFDLDFNHFITVKFVKVVYIVLLAIIFLIAALTLFSALLAGFAEDSSPWVFFFALIFVPIITLFYVVILRIFMEAVVVFFRIGENTTALVAALPPSASGTGSAAVDLP